MLRSKYKIISVEESDYGDHRHETTSDDSPSSDMPGLRDGDNESPPASDDDNVPALANIILIQKSFENLKPKIIRRMMDDNSSR